MIKKLTFSAVLLTMFILTSDIASANTYMVATSKAVDHIVGFHQDDNVIPEETPKEEAPKTVLVQKAKTVKTNVGRTITVQLSAYTSTPNQTDSSPFITANGEHVYWGGVAANIIDTNGRNIPFGTRIMIPGLFGDQIFMVNDRMNRRYQNNVDVWFNDIADARQLGRRTVSIVILAKN